MLKILATHTYVTVPDLAAAGRYLEEVCGFKKVRQVTRPGVNVVWYPGLELWEGDPEENPGVGQHLAWQVEDIDETVRMLKKRGVTFETESPKQVDVNLVDTREIIRYIFFTTPVGLRGELVEIGAAEEP